MIYRWELIQLIIDTCGLKSYLEIGAGGPRNQNYERIKCERKIGVDPVALTSEYRIMTSDQFFSQNTEIFDVVFIDGLHLCEQTIRDIVNSWNYLTDNGWIILHDCLPKNREVCTRIRTTTDWTGDVWKAIVWFRQVHPDLFCKVINMDWGCGIIFKNNSKKLFIPSNYDDYINLTFDWLQENLNLLNIVENKNETIRNQLFTECVKKVSS